MFLSGQTGRRRHYVRNLSVRLFIRPLPNLWTPYFENKWTDFDARWHKWFAGQGYETVNFGDQEVKEQSHTAV